MDTVQSLGPAGPSMPQGPTDKQMIATSDREAGQAIDTKNSQKSQGRPRKRAQVQRAHVIHVKPVNHQGLTHRFDFVLASGLVIRNISYGVLNDSEVIQLPFAEFYRPDGSKGRSALLNFADATLKACFYTAVLTAFRRAVSPTSEETP